MASAHVHDESATSSAHARLLPTATISVERVQRTVAYRDARGRYRRAKTALERFAAKCRFDPSTGCVVWVGGKTRGRGKTAWYGSFWYEGKRWTAHRWAAVHIHGLDIAGLDVDHKCANTLCQAHLQAIPGTVNSAYYWIRVEKGVIDLPEPDAVDEEGIPFFWPPDWFAQFLPPPDRDCPF